MTMSNNVMKPFVTGIGRIIDVFEGVLTDYSIISEISEICETVQRNKRIRGVMFIRVGLAKTAVKILKERRKEHKDFFSEVNYNNLMKLANVMSNMREFISEISQLNGFYTYAKAKDIEKAAIYLNRNLDSTIKILEFDFMIDFNARADIDNKKIKADIEDLSECLENIDGDLTNLNKTVSEVFEQLNVLNNTVNQIITDQKGRQGENSASKIELKDIEPEPFTTFLPLTEEVIKILKKRVDIYQTVKHKSICDVMLDKVQLACDVMLDRVQLAETVIKNLKTQLKDFISENNYDLRYLDNNVAMMRKFISENSEILYLHRIRKYIQAKNIERTAIHLNKELDFNIQLLEFDFMVDFNARADKDNEIIKDDIERLSEYLKAIRGDLTNTNKTVSEIFEQSSTLNNTVNQMITDQKSDRQGEESANFLPLIGEVRNKILGIGKIMYHIAEHNEKICDVIQLVERDAKYLKNRREKYEGFFSNANANFIDLQKLVNQVDAKREFLAKISQLEELDKYDAKRMAIYLNKEFDSTIQLLQFNFIVDFNVCVDTNNKKIQADIDGLFKHLRVIEDDLVDMKINISEVFGQLSTLNSTVIQMMTDQKK